MRRRAIIQWGLSSFFGWGVYGINLALAWSRSPEIEPLASLPIAQDQIVLDKLRHRTLEPFFAASADLVEKLRGFAGRTMAVEAPVFAALSNDFRIGPGAHGAMLAGKPNIGVVFFDSAQFDAETIDRARTLPLIVAGCTWNEKVLREYGLTNVTTVIQGIDPTLFHPAPRGGFLTDRFTVFSGGKLELRKAQDIVVAAFARFARRHPDALLVTAWNSPWPQLARGLDAMSRVTPVMLRQDGTIDVTGWCGASGIPATQVLDLGAMPNTTMPQILREMDVALFPNRSEGGTNLVAMECMACGVPTILSANTGHLDLIEDDNCYPILPQHPIAGIGAGVGATAGWGESPIDAVVDSLERIYADRAEARRRGERGAAKLAGLTWARTADAMKAIVLSQS